jgi:hypothetical protein
MSVCFLYNVSEAPQFIVRHNEVAFGGRKVTVPSLLSFSGMRSQYPVTRIPIISTFIITEKILLKGRIKSIFLKLFVSVEASFWTVIQNWKCSWYEVFWAFV